MSLFHLDRVVERLEHSDTLGAQLQVHQPVQTERNPLMLQRVSAADDQHSGQPLLKQRNKHKTLGFTAGDCAAQTHPELESLTPS